jgi:hypothetical protein
VEAQLAGMTRIACRDPEAARQVCEAVATTGYAILDHLLEPERLAALHGEFARGYARYLEDVKHPETHRVGHRRYLVPVAFSGGFADPAVWGHPLLLAAIRQLLGSDAIIEAFGGIVSLGHSLNQHAHRDSGMLFEQEGATGLPCHALTYALPLVGMDDWIGTTALWPASHRWPDSVSGAPAPDVPDVPAGSALLWDFRTWHYGTGNHTDDARPMLYATFSRSWYRDARNFKGREQFRLLLDGAFIGGLSADHRALFAHLGAPG